MTTYYVYGLIDPRTNLPFYIGKGKINPMRAGNKYRRVYDHLNHLDRNNPFKVRVIDKIIQMFGTVEYIIYNHFIEEVDAYSFECHLIGYWGRRNNNTGILTNLTDGGEGFTGRIMSDEQKQKQSLFMKAYYQTHPVNFKGCKHTLETRKKMSEAQKNMSEEWSNKRKGRKHSEETKEKIRQKNLGRRPPKDICYKFASHGKDNGGAKKYVFISPTKEIFQIHGEFKKFIKNMNLSQGTFKKFLNKGVIPPPIDPNHNRLTQERINSTGWEVKYKDD